VSDKNHVLSFARAANRTSNRLCDTKSQLRHQIASTTPNRRCDLACDFVSMHVIWCLRFRPCPFCSCAGVNLKRYKTELNLKNQNNGIFSPIVNLEKSKKRKKCLNRQEVRQPFPTRTRNRAPNSTANHNTISHATCKR
jgi:hypothetical protein